MDKEKLEKLKQYSKTLHEFKCFMHDDIVWEKQEGQPNHFDNLDKSERLFLSEILSEAISLYGALNNYLYYYS